MFERFTSDARWIVKTAVREAEGLGDTRVGTEHLLLAGLDSPTLARIGPGRSALRQGLARLDEIALEGVGIDPDSIKEIRGARPAKRRAHIPFTGGAKETLEGALKEAIALDHRHIGAEHIVLALTARPDTDRAIRILETIGTDPASLRQSLLEVLRQAS